MKGALAAVAVVLLALVGIVALLLRRKRGSRPSMPKRILILEPSLAFLNGRQLDMVLGSDIVPDEPWSAGLVLKLDRYGCEFVAGISRSRAESHVVFKIGSELIQGIATPQRLQFFDDPKQPGVRFAALNLQGTGGLSNVCG